MQDTPVDLKNSHDTYPSADLIPTQTSAPLIPWYLQTEAPQREPNPLLERQQIPELPPNPPPLLQPMLEHISIDLGLDDLIIFDLRDIDPPPALGADLLMILGTARSEKHLHVSADRFCRWLKITHKLSPYADGLLGRGELKLKLRRKARRARLLSNVGSSETSTADDGIRTGWICVNVGTIKDGRKPVEGFAEQEDYVGFGSEAGGAKVVIQMLTQEKRNELDLEDLWGKMLRRHERKESRISSGQLDLPSYQEVGQSSINRGMSGSNLRSLLSASLPKPSLTNFNQARLYHRRFMSSAAATPNPLDTDCERLGTFENRSIAQHPIHPEMQTDDGDERHVLPGVNVELTTLSAHLKYVQSMPSKQAIETLGKDAYDRASTPFLKSFYCTCLQSSRTEISKYCFALICHGITIGHSGYRKAYLSEIFEESQFSPPEVPTEVLPLLFDTFLTPQPTKVDSEGHPSLTKESVYSAVVVLDAMISRGHDVQTKEIHNRLGTAVKQAFRRYIGRITPYDADRLKVLLDNLHFRLQSSPNYALCLRMLAESLDQHAGVPVDKMYKWSDFDSRTPTP